MENHRKKTVSAQVINLQSLEVLPHIELWMAVPEHMEAHTFLPYKTADNDAVTKPLPSAMNNVTTDCTTIIKCTDLNHVSKPKVKCKRDLAGYSLELLGGAEADTKYLCSICRLLLKDPLQSFCGHRFCRQCFRKFIQ